MEQTSEQKINENKEIMKSLGGNDMFKQMRKHMKNQKGLTLIELLAVIVILAIVAAIAIPSIGNIIENSRIKAAKADVVNVINAANLYFVEHSDESEVSNTDLAPYLDSEGVLAGATYTVDKGTTTPPATSGGTPTVTPTSLSVTGKITVGNKEVTITGATIDGIDVDSADPTTDNQFKF